MAVVLARLVLVAAAVFLTGMAWRRLLRARPDPLSSPAHWLVLPAEAPTPGPRTPKAPPVLRLQWEPVIPEFPRCEPAAAFRFAPGYREAAWAMAATPLVSLKVEAAPAAAPEPQPQAEPAPQIAVDWSRAHHDLGEGAELPAFWLCGDDAIRLPADDQPELTGDAAFDPAQRLGFSFDAEHLWQLTALREHETGRAVYAS